jgi:hypothetical protein
MDGKGLVRRRRGAADGRRVSVSITPRGFQLFKVISQQSEQIYEALADELGADCMRDLSEVCERISVLCCWYVTRPFGQSSAGYSAAPERAAASPDERMLSRRRSVAAGSRAKVSGSTTTP